MAKKKSKGVRLFKVIKELNVARDTLVQHLMDKGYEVTDDSPNAKLTEEMYQEALQAFAEDRAAAQRHERRVQQIRQELHYDENGEVVSDEELPLTDHEYAEPAEQELTPAEEPDSVKTELEAESPTEASELTAVEPVEAAPEIEEVAAEVVGVDEEVSDEKKEIVEETTSEKETPVEVDVLAEPVETVKIAETVEPAEKAEAVEDAAVVEDAIEAPEVVVSVDDEVEAEAESIAEVEADTAGVEQATGEPIKDGAVAQASKVKSIEEVKKTVDISAVDDDDLDVLDLDDDLDDVDEETEELVKATRYSLAGPTVVGSVDLTSLPDDKAPKRKRKRKRKRKGDDAPAADAVADKNESKEPDSKKKRKRSRGPVVDKEAVDKSLQETLQEMGRRGTSRVRQRRRRARREEHAAEREREQLEAAEDAGVIKVMEYISANELAMEMSVQVTEVIRVCMELGMMVSINQRLDADAISLIADEFKFEVEFITDLGTEDIEIEEDTEQDLTPRAPVVTVMGHVDHGKTSLLDFIRSENVVAGESGGITQHIGAYRVKLPNEKIITFLDTPGHEAFTAMRARGAQVTDIVILVVAADDAVMPQTIEAINHAKAANTPIVVAVNKIDRENANTQKVMQGLSEHNVLVEQYGGQVQCSLVSAKTGEGVEDLLEKVLLEAEVLDLKANAERRALGTIIESRLDKGRGVVSTVLVQNGTMRVGDSFVAGSYSGRVRAMFDERDKRMEDAGPSEPALILGFNGAPEVGDRLVVLEDEREARAIAQKRQQIHREQSLRKRKHIALDDIGRRMALGELQELNIIVKADVAGSVEALTDSLHKLSTEEVQVSIIHTGVGAITESDVMLASASDAVILGFQVRPMTGIRRIAEREEIDIRTYSIIYDAIEDVHDALEGMLAPEVSEKTVGLVEVREIFKVPRIGTIAGSYVLEGRIKRTDAVHIIRDGVVIYDGRLSSLRRFKDDAKEVTSGYECGVSIENYNDIKVGDQIESFEMVETRRQLEV